MLSQGFVSAASIAASVLFILSLGGLSNQEKAKRAVWYGIVGMAVAVFFTALGPGIGGYGWLIPMVIIGAAIGWYVARRVAMTEMPQLVAALHSFVGLAAVFVAWNADLERRRVLAAQALQAGQQEFSAFAALVATKAPDELMFLQIEVVFAIFIGAVTFTGSVIAFGKLAGKVDGKPRQLPGGHMLNAGAAALSLLLAVLYLNGAGFWTLLLLAALAFFIGWHLIMGIGGADMPVVVSMLNSYSGWAAAAIGFTLSNDLLIVTGALVGSSGAILSYIMCKAMNRNFISVILGGFGGAQGPAAEIEGEQVAIDAGGVASALNNADSVVIVPGYGMAVAQAQGAVSELVRKLRAAGKEVRFAIHPVAGRLPGHMNVLLAEANVPYDEVFELEDINSEFAQADVAYVIGANDVTNPSARDDKSSPIYGMPVFDVDKAKSVMFIKRSMGGVGYAGVDNDVFYMDNTMMLLADAKKMVEEIVKSLGH